MRSTFRPDDASANGCARGTCARWKAVGCSQSMISSFLSPASLSFTHSLDTSDANPRALLLLDAKTRSYATLGRSHAARTRSAVVRAIILALFAFCLRGTLPTETSL